MTVLLDMNLSPRWVDALGQANIRAIHWSAFGRSDDPDTKIVGVALEFGYVILTQDLDFGILLAATNLSKPSVIQLRCEDLSPDVIGAQVCELFTHLEAELENGALVTFNPRRIKVRVLPFRQ